MGREGWEQAEVRPDDTRHFRRGPVRDRLDVPMRQWDALPGPMGKIGEDPNVVGAQPRELRGHRGLAGLMTAAANREAPLDQIPGDGVAEIEMMARSGDQVPVEDIEAPPVPRPARSAPAPALSRGGRTRTQTAIP